MVSHVCGPCSNPRCCCDSHPSSLRVQVKALVMDEAVARALEQLVLYVQGFDPAHADQEILYLVEVRPPEFVDGHLHYHQIRHPVWGHFD
eukprot:scaffold54306_cov38-Attheya_sp.AAC.5